VSSPAYNLGFAVLLSCAFGCTLFASPNARFEENFIQPHEQRLNQKYMGTEWLASYELLPPDSADSFLRFHARNEISQELMWLCDQDFERYIDLSYTSRTFFDIGSDLVVFGASSAAALATGGAATALSATAAGASGFKGIINANLYGDAAKDAIVVKMRAVRETARAEMFERMSDPVTEWPLSTALMDVSWYSRQGSARQAIQEIIVNAETEQLNQAMRVRNAQLQLGN